MSVNKVNKTTGELTTLANGTRMWIGTKAAHDAAVAAGTMPNNCMVCITDDGSDKTTKFPDYVHPLTVASTTAWTATEDCYVVYHYSAAGNSYTTAGQLYINGVRVDSGDYGGSSPGTSNSFSGYLKKGDILTREGNQPISSTSNCFRFFPLI